MTIAEDIFHDWQAPHEMRELAASFGDQLGNRAMRRPGILFREAFVASGFAFAQEAQAVRLLRPRQQATPDFAILLDDVEKWYETTEADRPRRKRMDEYADRPLSKMEHVPDEHWVEPEDYAVLIRALAARKAEKAYDKCDGLIIWSNAFPIAREDLMDSNWWRLAAEPARMALAEVWYHFNNRFSRAF